MNLFMIIFLIIVFIILLAIIFFQHRCIMELQDKLDDSMQENIDYKQRISMILYHIRAYREGTNGFTILRKIEDIVKKFED